MYIIPPDVKVRVDRKYLSLGADADGNISSLSFSQFQRKYRSELSYEKEFSYLSEPMRALETEKNVAFIKGSQVGVSELAITYILYLMMQKQRNIFYLLPTRADASDFSAARINPVLRNLSSNFEYDNVGHKMYQNANMYLRGSNSIARLKSVSVDCVVIDEYDEMREDAVRTVRERLSASKFKQELLISTPTLPDFGIFRDTSLFSKYSFFITCSSCSFKINCSYFFEQMLDVEREVYFCPNCKKKFDEKEKQRLVKKGKWEKVEGGEDGKVCFHIPQFLSARITAKEIAREYKACDSEVKKQIFWNHKLGLPYVAEGSRITKSLIEKVVGEIDSGSCMRCAGIDVSQSNLHYVVILSVFEGVGVVVEKILRLPWEGLALALKNEHVQTVVIDANPERHQARLFQEDWGNGCWLALYPQGLKVLYQEGEKEGMLKINRTEAIDTVLERFKKDTILIQKSAIDKEFDSFCSHLCSVSRQYREKQNGSVEAYYVEVGADHYLHALVYAEIASRFVSSATFNQVVGSFL